MMHSELNILGDAFLLWPSQPLKSGFQWHKTCFSIAPCLAHCCLPPYSRTVCTVPDPGHCEELDNIHGKCTHLPKILVSRGVGVTRALTPFGWSWSSTKCIWSCKKAQWWRYNLLHNADFCKYYLVSKSKVKKRGKERKKILLRSGTILKRSTEWKLQTSGSSEQNTFHQKVAGLESRSL